MASALVRQTGLYEKTFQELEKLGGGGQGSVYKVVHKLDEKEYAVKKVPFSKKREKELRREVLALSDLSHENIVRYFSAWIEDRDGTEEDSSVVFGSPDVEDQQTQSARDDSSVVFDSKETDNPQLPPPPAKAVDDGEDGWEDVKGDDDDDDDNEDDDESDDENNDTEGSDDLECDSVLYIQMELCSSTLRDWLDERMEGSPRSAQEMTDKMYQMLKGIKFVHERGLIHRDLKPENIFLQGNLVKIGDFGLAKTGGAGETETHGAQKKRYWGGTAPYAAPEVVRLENYDEKSDIYSLGVVLLEMCYEMPTWQERTQRAHDLQQGECPKQLTNKVWKKQKKAMLAMCQRNAELRPSAEDLLCGPLFLTKDEEIDMLRARVKKKNIEIKDLKQ